MLGNISGMAVQAAPPLLPSPSTTLNGTLLTCCKHFVTLNTQRKLVNTFNKDILNKGCGN